MAVAAFLLVLAGALGAGWSLGRLLVGPEDGWAFRCAMWLAAGLVAVHVILAWLDLAGIRWHALAVIGVLTAGALAGRRWIARTAGVGEGSRGAGRRGAVPGGLDWAALAGAAMVAFFALLAVSRRITFPDFVYHWGIKGHRYFLARGIDYDFLGRDWNLVAHRDYPQLVPELYAFQSMVAGQFSEPMLLLWSAVFFAALLMAARAALDAWAVREEWARVVSGLLALALGVFAVGHLMAGSVDWIVAFALTAALPALRPPPVDRGRDAALADRRELQLGVLAALAASSKLEGIPLAVLLVGAGGWRRLREELATRRRGEGGPEDRGAGLRSLGSAALRLAGPPIVAVTPWLVQGLRHDLFRDPQSGAFEAARAPAIASAVWEAMLCPEWHLVSFVLVLLPLLFLCGETRLAGAVVALQLGGYLLRYFTATFDYRFSVLSSFPRLVFHLLPAVVLGLTVVADRWTPGSDGRGSGRSAHRSRSRPPGQRSRSAAS